MDPQFAGIDPHIAHINHGIADIKTEQRRIDDKFDKKFDGMTARLDVLRDKVETSTAAVSKRIDDTHASLTNRLEDAGERLESVRKEVTAQIEDVREDVSNRLENVRSELTRLGLPDSSRPCVNRFSRGTQYKTRTFHYSPGYVRNHRRPEAGKLEPPDRSLK